METSSAVTICGKELRRYFGSWIAYSLMIAAGALFGLGIAARDPEALLAPVLRLGLFSPAEAFDGNARFTLMAGLMRVAALFAIPMISMGLFVEERRRRTIELLFTSPVRDEEIVLGKWAGAMVLYAAILVGAAIGMAAFRWSEWDAQLAAAAYGALLAQGAGLMAVGEAISTLTRHEGVAAFWTLLAGCALWAFCHRGVIGVFELGVCLVCWRAGGSQRGARFARCDGRIDRRAFGGLAIRRRLATCPTSVGGYNGEHHGISRIPRRGDRVLPLAQAQ
jgi:ABC-2 type transport system permease protein